MPGCQSCVGVSLLDGSYTHVQQDMEVIDPNNIFSIVANSWHFSRQSGTFLKEKLRKFIRTGLNIYSLK